MSNATKLHAFTLALQAQFASAAELRIRRATRGGVTVFQLIGHHPKHGKIGRKIPATSEAEVLTGAIELMNQLDLGIPKGVVLTGVNRGLARSAIERIQTMGLRHASTDTRIRRIREVVDLLEERGLKASEYNLKLAIKELAPDRENRRRRALCTAARDVAIAAKIELDLTGLSYKERPPKRLEDVDDSALFRRLDKHLPKCGNDGAIWLLRMVAVTGIRGNGCLSLDQEAFDIFGLSPDAGKAVNWQMQDRVRYWDSKRGRAAFASQTIREWYELWDLYKIPAELKPYWMPCDRPPTNDQVEKANKLLNNINHMLRAKVHPEATKSIGFRALRHAATARLLKAGVPILDVAEITSTSITQIERTYADMYRETAANRAADLL